MARIFGVLAAILFLALFGLSYAAFMRPDHIVVPTGGVMDGGPQDTVPVGPKADEILAARTRLQMWRGISGPAPGIPTKPTISGEQVASSPPSTPPRDIVQSWLARKDDDWSILRASQYLAGSVSLPESLAGVLQQPQGRDWRRLQNEQIVFIGGFIIFGVAFLLALFLAVRGRIRNKEGESGQEVKRFNLLERINHWVTAVSFILLALTGLLIIYGNTFLAPALGAPGYRNLLAVSVYVHVISAIPFVLGVLIMILLWVRENWLTRVDLAWIARAGGLFGGREPSAYRFNAGQKGIFWAVVATMVVMLATGLTLIFPFAWFGYTGMQWAQVVHALVALIIMGIILGHIYLGTVGEQGAFQAMWSGNVDRNWALQHHDLWYRELQQRGEAD